jgi:DNA polymerase III subunit epsilon
MTNLLSKISFVDVETTGTSPMSDRIIDIGIVRVEEGKIVEEFESLVNPQTHLSPFITQMTSITPEMLYKAPYFEEIKSRVWELLSGTTFIAHNAQFDYAFIKQEFARLETKFKSRMLCTVRLSRALFPNERHHNLDAIIQRFGFVTGTRHRAFPDARVLFDFIQKSKEVVPTEAFENAVKTITSRSKVPAAIAKEVIKNIPNQPGVYIFYDKDGTVLYVGKSRTLKKRIISHFSAFHSNRTDFRLAASVADIEIKRTGGDLSASLLEADLIKKLQPIFNKRLRLLSEAVVLIKNDKSKYHSLEIKRIRMPLSDGFQKILSIYPSIKRAREEIYEICKEKHICPRVSRLEKGKGACIYYQIGKCDGACIGRVSALKHNMKLIEAFGDYFIPRWPFSGTVAIKEESADLAEITFIDNWMHLGSTIYEDSQVIKKPGKKEIYSDTVKILKRYLIRPEYLKKIVNVRYAD